MKFYILALFFVLTTVEAFANTGFVCPKEGIKISKFLLNDKQSTLLIEHADGKTETNHTLIAPEGNDIDAYETRFGIYNEIRANTQSFFPYMPEFLMVYHMSRSQKLYMAGFKVLDGQNNDPAVELGSMYCKALLTSILKYYP